MFDDRPIKPDAKYLQQFQNKIAQQKVTKRQFLHKASHHILPCYKDNRNHHKAHQNEALQLPKQTKAQIYQQIKKKNRQKFGEWEANRIPNQQHTLPQKKIKPNQITVSYKPKTVNIDTREYKKQGYVPPKQSAEAIIDEKQQYKKMISYMRTMCNQFEKEKEQFQKQKEYLKFRKVIEKQSGIQIESRLNLGRRTLVTCPQGQSLPISTKVSKIEQKKQFETNIEREQEKDEIPNCSQNLKQFSYSIDKLYQCNPFTLKQIYTYSDRSQFLSQNCPLYKTAKNIIQTQRHYSKSQIIKPKCTHGSIGANHVTCSDQQCAQKRVTKFSEEWFELWIAGKYRNVYNAKIGYKVVWYGNGDVKQEFGHGKVKTYESKAKKLVEIRVLNHLPFWYFPLVDQLEMKDKDGNTQIIFADGRHQIQVAPEAE